MIQCANVPGRLWYSQFTQRILQQQPGQQHQGGLRILFALVVRVGCPGFALPLSSRIHPKPNSAHASLFAVATSPPPVPVLTTALLPNTCCRHPETPTLPPSLLTLSSLPNPSRAPCCPASPPPPPGQQAPSDPSERAAASLRIKSAHSILTPHLSPLPCLPLSRRPPPAQQAPSDPCE